MKTTLGIVAAILIAVGAIAYSQASGPAKKAAPHKFAVVKSDAEWRKILPAETYYVTRQKGTERAFSGQYAESHEKGIYVCADCGQPLFKSDTKFDSGTGWPSFWAPITPKSVLNADDRTLGMDRTEVVCSRCGAHLGHVFDDGPKPTGLRYCMNSVALKLVKK